jgi:ribosome-associated protein
LRNVIEGEAEGGWVLIDFSDVIVHLFSPEQRSYYALEDLWKDARLIVRMH